MSIKRYTFLDLASVNEPFIDRITEAVTRVALSGRYIGGHEVDAFEQELADSCGASYAIGTGNGLDALRLIYRAYIELGIMKPGDEVIVPGNTFIASVLAITDNGLVPVFADVDDRTMNLDTNILERYISPLTKSVMTVHLYGRTCFDSRLTDFAKLHGLKIVEDNAQAIGALSLTPGLSGKFSTGALGDAAAYSFYPTKNIGAIGDAGAVTTSDCQLAETIRALHNYGSDRQYHNIFKGLNSRLDPIQAAVLRAKLPYTASENALRHANASIYEQEISNPAIIKPMFANDGTSVWHQYVVQTKDREGFRAYLTSNGVETAVHYPTAPFDQPCYKEFGNAYCPVARRLASQVVSLPISRCTSTDDAREIASIINAYNPD